MSDLIAKLEAAEVGSRELDAEVEVASGYLPENYLKSGGTYESWKGKRPGPTRSLDAALALAERVLPGWGWETSGPFEQAKDIPRARLDSPEGDTGEFAYAATAPLALCIAILRAKEAQS